MDNKNSTSLEMNTLLLVGNYASDVGYAWWLMESFWAILATYYQNRFRVLLSYPKITSLSETISKAPLQLVQIDFNGNKFINILKQCQFIKEYKIQIIYFSDRATFSWKYLLYKMCGVKLIIVHDHTPGIRRPNKLINNIKKIIHRLPMISVDGAIGATEFVRKRLIRVNGFPSHRCYVVPNGIPAFEKTTDPVDLHKMFDIQVNRKILIMTGRAHRYKGVDIALKIIGILPERYIEKLHFIFIGDGPDLSLFKNIAKDLKISGHCSFPGRRSDIHNLLLGADFAIHPSHGEVGYSLSILEYMRAGLPVILPDNPSVSGIVRHRENGIVYPEGNTIVASALIRELIDDKYLRNAISIKAKTTSEEYKLEKAHMELIKAFEDMINGKFLNNS